MRLFPFPYGKGLGVRLPVNKRSVWIASLSFVLATLIFFPESHLNAETDDAAQIKKLSSDYATALINRDTKFLDLTLAPDELNVGTNGQPFDRQALIARIQDPKFSYKKIDIADLVVQVIGAMALTRGIATVTTETSGQTATDNFRFIRIWQHQSGKWQVIYFQATHIQA
jgi:ketosteroid isomerase-like protein